VRRLPVVAVVGALVALVWLPSRAPAEVEEPAGDAADTEVIDTSDDELVLLAD